MTTTRGLRSFFVNFSSGSSKFTSRCSRWVYCRSCLCAQNLLGAFIPISHYTLLDSHMAGAATQLRLPSLSRPPASSSKPERRRTVRVSAAGDDSSTPRSPTSVGISEKPDFPAVHLPQFSPPQPRPFYVRMDKFLDILTASLAMIFRLGCGIFVLGYSRSLVPKTEVPPGKYAMDVAGYKLKETSVVGPRPEKPIEIYEYESCPFCRKVREIVSFLDLDVLFYPCPKNGPNFRPMVAQLGGKQQFPYMVDPNTGVAMYESDDIIKYLVAKYGNGTIPLMLSLGPLTTFSAILATLCRVGKGSSYKPSKVPQLPLEVWSYEPSPFSKIVREVLVELELPHLLHSVGRGSPKRQELFERVGHFQAPYLEDPNTGVKMFESAEIIDYLKATYLLQ